MAHWVIKESASDEEKILQLTVSESIINGINELSSAFECIGATKDSIKLNLLLRAAKEAMGETHPQRNMGIAEVWSYLSNIDDKGDWNDFESRCVRPIVQAELAEVDHKLREAFLDRLSARVRDRYDEVDSGDISDPPDEYRGLARINLTRKQLVKILSYSDGKFELFEKRVILRDLNSFDFDQELELQPQRSIIDQDTDILKFDTKCKDLGLQRKKTIPREILYDIMKDIGNFSGTLKEFTTKCAAYTKGREYASRLRYSNKRSWEERT